ncbi:hypothetical protein D3C84_970990 [compost metagenome]
MCISDFGHRRQGHNTFIGFDFDICAWNAFFSDQISFDLGGDPGIGNVFLGLCHFARSQHHWRLSCLSGLGECASHGQGQSGSSGGSDSELLHTSNSCFSQNLSEVDPGRVIRSSAKAVPAFKHLLISYKSAS